MLLKETVETVVDAVLPSGKKAKFSMSKLVVDAWPYIESDPEIEPIIGELREIMGDRYLKGISEMILRNVFLIELVNKPAIETTWMRVRWIEELENDPRGCSFEECMQIAKELLTSLPSWINADRENRLELFRLSYEWNLIPYEGPIDYVSRLSENGKIHTLGNISWYADDLSIRTLRLRSLLRDRATSPDPEFFNRVLADKIKVKTYLTDRVLTGAHKTNREKRWEVHPESVHFAERKVCLAIEYILATQLCQFEGFPSNTIRLLRENGTLTNELHLAYCPITGDALSYEHFRTELDDPEHGKSSFQVGHLNPLKLDEQGAEASGHSAENISWISADGNRIQGSLSLTDVRLLIARIKVNYDRHRWWPQVPV